MGSVSDLARQLRAAFAAELPDRTGALERGLLALEEADGVAAARALADLYAAAYNLQGAARVVELADLAHLAGALAAAFDAARQPDTPLAAAWFAAARRAVATLPALAAAGHPGERPDGFFDVLADLVAPPGTAFAPAPTPPAVSAPPPAVAPPQGQAGESVRVNVGKLDTLLAQTGELAVTRIRVGQRLAELTALRNALGDWQREWRASRRGRAALRQQLDGLGGESGLARELAALLRAAERAEARAHDFGQQVAELAIRLRGDVAQLGLVAEGLADEVLAARLLPVASAFGPFERLVRDLSREQGKAIDLALAGGETEIDRTILERLRDPLMHMLRNAVDHGIESPEARIAAGKPATGRIGLAVANRGGAIEIVLADDGAGLDVARLRATAVRKGLLTAERAEALDEEAAFGLIFQPGFSTVPVATATSGRGVGMDVARDEVARLSGHIRVASAPGQGTTFTITAPLTLATTRAILVEQAGRTFAIPSAPIERTARVRASALVALEGRRAVLVEGRPVPVAELAELLLLPPPARPPDPRAWRSFIVLRQDERRVALLIDRLTGEQELVIKPLGWPLRRVRNVGGAAVLGSGETVPILNPADLLQGGLRLARAGARAGAVAGHERPAATVSRRRRVLVVDDSLTTRMLERGILEAAGYDTLVAGDGAEALGLLAREAVDLVISDVEMPNLDGFGLTAAIRRDERLRHLPVVLVTSLDDPEHRERGVSAGADAYLGKRTFDQGQLLDTIGRLL
jgi:two-component system chemotaxis sensor kinase CheA